MKRQTVNEQRTATNEEARRPERRQEADDNAAAPDTPAGESYANSDEQATLVAGDGARANTPESDDARNRTRPASDTDAGDAQDQSSGPVAGHEARRAAR